LLDDDEAWGDGVFEGLGWNALIKGFGEDGQLEVAATEEQRKESV